MPHQMITTVYEFDELADSAKNRAREWMREHTCTDNDWYDYIFEDVTTIAGILGIEIGRRSFRTVGGDTGTEPTIYFSGFSSQGDGACFEGCYAYAKESAKKIRTHAPEDTRLHQIADKLTTLQKAHGYRLTATIKHTGGYSYEYSTSIEVYDGDDAADTSTDEALAKILRAFMRWIYRQLEAEYEYQMSDEQIDERIRANEYSFNLDGTRA